MHLTISRITAGVAAGLGVLLIMLIVGCRAFILDFWVFAPTVVPLNADQYPTQGEPITLGDPQDRAWSIPPRQTSPQPITLMVIHGSGARMEPTAHWMRRLDVPGLSIVVPEFSGYGDGTGLVSEAKVLQRLSDQCRWLKATRTEDKIIVLGYSLGGNLAMRFPQDCMDGLIVLGSFADTRHLAPWGLGALAWGRFDAKAALARQQVPTVLFHALRDSIVPFREQARIAQLIPADSLRGIHVIRDADHHVNSHGIAQIVTKGLADLGYKVNIHPRSW